MQEVRSLGVCLTKQTIHSDIGFWLFFLGEGGVVFSLSFNFKFGWNMFDPGGAGGLRQCHRWREGLKELLLSGKG